MLSTRCNTVIVGGGPAALAPLISACHDGRIGAVLREGVVVLEQGERIGSGRLGSYSISSDSTALTFLSAVTDDGVSGLAMLKRHPIYAKFEALGHSAVSLAEAAELLDLIGEALHAAIVAAGGRVLVNHKVEWARRHADGWVVRARDTSNEADIFVAANHLVVATGGHQPVERLASDPVAGTPLLPKFADKLICSDDVLQPCGTERLYRMMARSDDAHVAIVGGSTSAVAAADMLLRSRPEMFAAPGSIKILHRRPLRVFYRSVEDALADGYTEFGDDDVCPISGFVYRLAGFRLHSRELLMRILEIGGRAQERRVVLHRIVPETWHETQHLLETSAAVIAATGYRPKALPLRDERDEPIPLMANRERAPLVDRGCRILDADGRVVHDAYAIGLAAGFVPSGALGGERSFVGQANGLWLWQTAVGALIVDQMLARPTASSLMPDITTNETTAHEDLVESDALKAA